MPLFLTWKCIRKTQSILERYRTLSRLCVHGCCIGTTFIVFLNLIIDGKNVGHFLSVFLTWLFLDSEIEKKTCHCFCDLLCDEFFDDLKIIEHTKVHILK